MKKEKNKMKIKREIIIFLIVLVIFFFTFTFFSVHSKNLIQQKSCDFLACEYKGKILSVMNIILMPLGFPLISNPYAQSSFSIAAILIIYWSLFAFPISILYCKFKKEKKTRAIYHNEKEKSTHILYTFGRINMIIMFFLLTFNAFFYYPKIDAGLTIQNFLYLASFIVILDALVLSLAKRTKKYFRDSIISLSFVSITFLLLGTFISFIFSVPIPGQEGSLVDVASIHAFKIGFFGASLVGLVIIIYIILLNFVPGKN